MLSCKREQSGPGHWRCCNAATARGTQAETANPVLSGAGPSFSRSDFGRMGEAVEHHRIKRFFLTFNWRCKEAKYFLKHKF